MGITELSVQDAFFNFNREIFGPVIAIFSSEKTAGVVGGVRGGVVLSPVILAFASGVVERFLRESRLRPIEY